MLGTEIIEEEMPTELSDLYYETRVAIKIHSFLKDVWDGMNGVYLGKSLEGLDILFDVYKVDTLPYKEYILNIINFVDYYIYQDIERKKKQRSTAKRNT